jgi:hypothetical protein
MSYIVSEQTSYGWRSKIDEQKFAADLARELGGKVEHNTFQNNSVYIVVGNNKLFVRADNHKMRVNVSISCAEMAWNEWGSSANQKTTSATIHPAARSIASIAKDIRKRVIEANAPALAARRAYVAAKARSASDLVTHAETLRKVPGLRVEMNGESAEVSATGLYMYARLESYGKVTIERLESLPIDKFIRVMAILNEKEST